MRPSSLIFNSTSINKCSALCLNEVSIIFHYIYIMTDKERQMELERLWKHQQSPELIDELEQRDRESEPLAFKIIKKKIVIRTKQYVIYQAIRKTQSKNSKEFTFKEISVKKYEILPWLKESKGSEQYQFLSKNEELQKSFNLRPFNCKQHNYLQLGRIQYTLQDKLKNGVREFREQKDQKINIRAQFYNDFKRQMLDLLEDCHKRKSPIFLGSLSPASIGVFQKQASDGRKEYTYSLINFSHANIKDASKNLHLYDLRYLAPQYTNLSQSSDMWSLGCIIYELLSNGDKLINDIRFHKLSAQDRTIFVQDRLKELNCKIRHINSTVPQIKQKDRLKFPYEALALLRRCLMLKEKSEKSQEQLLSGQQLQFYKNKIVYDISMQIFRLNVLQDNIMCVFEELYFNSNKSLKKHHLYPLLKFASCVYLQAYNRVKDKAKSYAKNEKWDKYSQVKRIQEEKKLIDVRDKAANKLIKELQQQKNHVLKNVILSQFPEIIEDRVSNPKEVFQAYWSFIKADLCKFQNINFFKYLYYINFYMQEVSQMEQFLSHIGRGVRLRFDKSEMQEKKDPQLIYFQQANTVSDIIEQEIQSIVSVSNIAESQKKDAQQRMQQALQTSLRATR